MTSDPTLTDASAFPRLVVTRGRQVLKEVVLQADLSIGRADDNDLTLMDPKVSRHHARIRQEGATFVLTDLDSANGTLVNGVRLTGPHVLQHGERIGIGDSELTYQEPGRSSDETVIAPAAAAVTQASVSRPPVPPVSPPPFAPTAAPVRRARGARRGLNFGIGVVAAILVVAAVVAALYFLAPGLFGRESTGQEATPTQMVAVATTSIPPQTAEAIESPAVTAEAATPEATTAPPTAESSPTPVENLDDLLAQAEALTRRSRFEDAIAIYQNLLQQAPDEARLETCWTWTLIWDDEAEQALAHAERAVDLDPDSAEAAAALARAYIETGENIQALALARQAVQLDPGSANVRSVLAEAYMVNGQNQNAVDEADHALVLDLNNADAHRIRGWLYQLVDNDMGQAAGQLQVAAGLQPELWLRRHELGVLLLEAADYTTAIMAFQDALGIRPEAVTYTQIGAAYYRLAQYDQAAASLRQALAEGAEDLYTYALLGATYASQERCDDAETYYVRALALDAADPLALEAKAVCEGAWPSPSPSPTTVSVTIPTPVATPKPTTPPPAPASLSGRIAFPRWNAQTNQYDVYIANAKDGSGKRLIVDGMHQPAFSPDGLWLAVNGTKPDHLNLFIIKADGSGLKKITDYKEDKLPTWSPDGGSIAFATTRDLPGRPKRIYIIDQVPFVNKPQPERLLTFGSGDVQGEYPTWAPGGAILYQGCDYTVTPSKCGLFSIPSGGGAFKQLTDNGEDTAPDAHGDRIAFMSNRDGNWEIYVMKDDGSAMKRLTNNASSDGLPTWSPDGKTLAFVSNQDGPWAVWAMSPDGSNRRKLFDIGGQQGLVSDWQYERISWAP